MQLIPHVAAVHVAEPFVGTGQIVEHPPQLSGSVCSLTHVPLQSVYGELQVNEHVPPEPSQFAVLFAGGEQAAQLVVLAHPVAVDAVETHAPEQSL